MAFNVERQLFQLPMTHNLKFAGLIPVRIIGVPIFSLFDDIFPYWHDNSSMLSL